MDRSNNIAAIHGDTDKHFKSRLNRNIATFEHSPGGPLHQANNRILALNTISNNKRRIFGDQLLIRGSKNLHLLLSPEYLQTVFYSPKPHSSTTTNSSPNREQASSCDYIESHQPPQPTPTLMTLESSSQHPLTTIWMMDPQLENII